MKKYSLVFCLFFTFIITSCAPHLMWMKPGAGQNEFQHSRYGCLQRSQQRVSNAHSDSSRSDYDNRVITNNDLFNACMEDQGWMLTKVDKRKSRKQDNNIPE